MLLAIVGAGRRWGIRGTVHDLGRGSCSHDGHGEDGESEFHDGESGLLKFFVCVDESGVCLWSVNGMREEMIESRQRRELI